MSAPAAVAADPSSNGANIQDRDGTRAMLLTIGKSLPWLRHIFADALITATSQKLRFVIRVRPESL
jgi:hypothetical protein